MFLDLFSFYGRVSRVGWWLRTGLITPLIMFLGLIPLVFSSQELVDLTDAQRQLLAHAAVNWNFGEIERLTSTKFMRGFYAFLGFMAFASWINYAATARRFHDRNKTGLWALISFVPVIGPFWIFIECGFMNSVDQNNQFDLTPAEQSRHDAFNSLAERIEAEAAARKTDPQPGGWSQPEPAADKAVSSSVQPARRAPSASNGPRKSFGRKTATAR